MSASNSTSRLWRATAIAFLALSLEVYDREYFVDFSFAEKDPVKLVGAPAQCKLSVARPQEMSAALSQQLSQLGPNQRDPSLTVGAEFANKILVKCP